MSLSTLITFAFLVKKVTQKNQPTKTFRPKNQITRQDSNTSITSCSSNDETDSISSRELKDHSTLRDSQPMPVEPNCVQRHKVVVSLAPADSEKETEKKEIDAPPNTPSSLEAAGPPVVDKNEASPPSSKYSKQHLLPANLTHTHTHSADFNVIIRDFAYPTTSSLHHGKSFESNQSSNRLSEISLSSSEFTGRQARVLYDFYPETEYEIAIKAGQLVWVQYRQCHGWLIADVNDDTGLIPESYVEFTSENI